MIFGIGVDVVEIERMNQVIKKWGNVFLKKVFTDNELSYAEEKYNPAQHIAARFAVKEAVSKALSTGWGGGFRWKDIEIKNDETGKPNVIVHGKMKDSLQNCRIMVSISHSENVVVASAIIEKIA
jgi:holo-[acyl-carrier protein] synthase